MLIPHKGHTDTIQVYSVTVMTHVKALQAGHSSQGTSEPITPGQVSAGDNYHFVKFSTISYIICVCIVLCIFLHIGPACKTVLMNE